MLPRPGNWPLTGSRCSACPCCGYRFLFCWEWPWLALAAGLLLGALRYQITHGPVDAGDIAYYVGERYAVVGTVARPPVQYDACTQYRVDVDYLVTSAGERMATNGRLQLTLLDVAGGEARLFRTPGGRTLLINGGSSAVELSEQIGQQLPPLQRRLDWLVVAGVRQEQLTALVNSVERLDPPQLAWAGDPQASRAAAQLRTRLISLGIPTQALAAGQRFDLGEDAWLDVLAVGPRGALLQLSWLGFNAILPLGLDFDMLDEFDQGWVLGPVDLFLLADNGYAPLNPLEWIGRLDPAVVWLSVGPDQPSADLLDALDGRTLLRTDYHGWLQVSTDGHSMWLAIEK